MGKYISKIVSKAHRYDDIRKLEKIGKNETWFIEQRAHTKTFWFAHIAK